MRAQQRSSYRGALGCLLVAGLVLACCQPLFADGGVTFTNIAGNGTGIAYQRFGTPAREADQQAFYASGIDIATFSPAVLAMTPQKPRGAPGVALFDYDNDGDIDVYVTNGPGHANSLYQNLLADTGHLTFFDVAASAHVTATAQDSSGVCYGDVDNDGFEDLYVTGIGEPNVFFHNNGDGTFTDITAAANLGAGKFHHSGCAMGDFDGDGLLDIAVGNTYKNWLDRPVVFLPVYDSVEPNQLFLREGSRPDIHFANVSTTSGIRNLGRYANLNGASYTWAIAAVDYDQDGDVDIMWADTNGPPPNVSPREDRGWVRVLQNDGHAHFQDRTRSSGLAKTGSWMGLSYGDFNCDDALDVFVTNLGDYVGGRRNQSRWFLGDGNGHFSDPGLGPNIKASVFGWGTSVIDYDNDGDQDIFYYGDDDLLNLIAMDNKGTILQNHGCNADFTYDTGALLTDHRLREVNGEAAGDLNNDGWQDVATVAMFRIIPAAPNRVLPITLVTGPLDPLLDTIGQVLLVMARTSATATKLTLLPGLNNPNGDLALEINSGGNGNGWVKVETLGTVGLIAGSRANRDGLGATLKFMPDAGETVISPVVGGGSHASQDSRIRHFGLGTAAKGTVEVLWPGKVKNVLYDVKNGETITFPEIPCTYDVAAWKSFGQFNSCVSQALTGLRRQGVLTSSERQRFLDSARQLFSSAGRSVDN